MQEGSEQTLRRRSSGTKEYLTLKEAADLVGKTPNNISYLVQYVRLNKYNSDGERITRANNGELRVSRSELLTYLEESDRWVRKRMKQLSISDMELAFVDIPERERTKHVHRLHPYLGKFIPQLVEYFLSRHFQTKQVVIDPFCGSGTTLVQAAEMGIHSIGVDISEFNTLIARAKLAKYDLDLAHREIMDISKRTVEYSRKRFEWKDTTLTGVSEEFETDSEYLKTWFHEQSLQEMLFYRSLIPNYRYQNLLKVLLSRTVRSCRLIYHYELATPSKPVREPYPCYKHKGKICTPVNTIIPRLKYYSVDTIRRLREFSQLRRDCESLVIEGDSKEVNLKSEANHLLAKKNWYERQDVRGVFSSPPYVGQIDYHEQHRYAYELFGFERRDVQEIGPKSKGKGVKARQSYVSGISEVFNNINKYLPTDAVWFVVANDSLNLYPEIFEKSGLRVKKTFHRPVEDRTERDKRPYSESIFEVIAG